MFKRHGTFLKCRDVGEEQEVVCTAAAERRETKLLSRENKTLDNFMRTLCRFEFS